MYRSRDEKINAGLHFILHVGLKGDRYKSQNVKDFWIKLQALINDKIDGFQDEPEATPEMAEELFKEDA